MTTPTTPTATRTPSTRPRLDPARAGLQDALSMSAGVVPFGIVLGVTADALHSGALPTLLGAPAVFGGSAQLTTLTVLHLGAGTGAAVLSGIVVNSRLLLYSAAAGARFARQPAWFRLLAPTLLQDQTFLSASARPELEGAAFRSYWGRLGAGLLAAWTAAVAAGLLLGPLLPPLPHLALVGTALFVALLVPRLVHLPAVAGAATGAVTAWLVAQVVPELGILAGTAAGVAAALACRGTGTGR